MDIPFDIELAWARRHMVRVQKALANLPDLHTVRLAMSMHLDLKTILLVDGCWSMGRSSTWSPVTRPRCGTRWLHTWAG